MIAGDFFYKTLYIESVDSTNTYLKKRDCEDRIIIYTFNQTKGRGRNEKQWIDFKNKNLAISFLLKPATTIKNNIWYVAACSLALIKVLEKLRIKNSWIKWPNDVYIKNDKLAGILTESVWLSGKIERLIIGIGININCNLEDLSLLKNKATSIIIQTGEEYDLHDFFYIYKDELSKWLFLLIERDGIPIIRKEWIKKTKIVNKNVEWINNNNVIKGTILGINLNGSLLLKTDKQIINVISGEIRRK